MTTKNEPILVIGATGQQGGATAQALLRDGWRVRALVRDPSSAKAQALAARGVELLRGDLREPTALARAAEGVYGVFSVQPTVTQPEHGFSEDDERRTGIAVIDAAQRAGVRHLVYTSAAGVGPQVDAGNFHSKWHIEQHLRGSELPFTILQPAPFMELVLQPVCGLPQGKVVFFAAPDKIAQFIAVHDIGVFAARAFADPARYVGATLELAGDALSWRTLADKISRATGRTVTYESFPSAVTAANPLFARIVRLVDEGKLVGRADLTALRALHPELLTVDAWLAAGGADAIAALLPRA